VITLLRRTSSRVVLATAALSLAVALSGCGSTPVAHTPITSKPVSQPTSSAPATSSSDSCSVVAQSDVSTALGESVRPGVRGKATVEGGIACVFYGPSVAAGTDPDIPVPNSVRVVLVTGADGTKWFDDYKSKVPAVALSALGDQAYYDGSSSVSVLKGSAYLRIAVIKATGTDEAAEEALAATALPRM
jgi:lipopolysaccharide export system protein LptA